MVLSLFGIKMTFGYFKTLHGQDTAKGAFRSIKKYGSVVLRMEIFETDILGLGHFKERTFPEGTFLQQTNWGWTF